MAEIDFPLKSLASGRWFKLICGASFQHLPTVRNLTLAYSLAGADCIDVAADPGAIAAAKEALDVAGDFGDWARSRRFGFQGRPWLMVSFNDGEDPHFRKAEFDPAACPQDCWRPCQKVCPAEAIAFSNSHILGAHEAQAQKHFSLPPDNTDFPSATWEEGNSAGLNGVISDLCYGCGRCLPVCPSQLIYTRSYVSTPGAIAPLILEAGIDGIEIHTQIGRDEDFQRLIDSIRPWIDRLKVVAISCPNGIGIIDYFRRLYEIISPLSCPLIWQTDGRPMSGDIGPGTTLAAVNFAQKVLAASLPGYVQPAGGTNNCTVEKLKAANLLSDKRGLKVEKQTVNYSSPIPHYSSPITNSQFVAGVAYGSYARFLLSPTLEKSEKMQQSLLTNSQSKENFFQPTMGLLKLEAEIELLLEAVSLADSLVSQIKGSFFPNEAKNG